MTNKIVLYVIIFIVFAPFLSKSQNFESSNLPIIKINTSGVAISNEPKITAIMQIIYNGPGKINNVNDIAYNYNGSIGIELRGSSSQAIYDKKNFGVETRDSLGQNLNVSLLGLPDDNDWVLYGPYGDKSLLRNVIEYKLSNDMGRYASRTKFCELILNGEYWGFYVLMEKVKRGKDRVDISKLQPDENSGDDLTGGYIVKLDKYDGANSNLGWASPYHPPWAADLQQTVFFQYDYPKDVDISAQQMNYIKEYVTAFEDALNKSDYNNPITGYAAFADVNSMVDYFILNEISHNVDGYRLSTFIHKDKNSKGGKLIFGPVWDYNLAFGNADYCDGGLTTGWAYQFNYVCNTDTWLIPFWWGKLYSDATFRTLIVQRWAQLREGPLKTETVLNYIDSTVDVIHDAEVRNFQRWNILGQYIWPNLYIGSNYNDEIKYLKDWITTRFEWMDLRLNSAPDALEDNQIAGNTSVYPNPFSDQLNIDLPYITDQSPIIHVYDLFGKEVWRQTVTDNHTENKLVWYLKNKDEIGKGVYLLTLSSGSRILLSRKIIKTD